MKKTVMLLLAFGLAQASFGQKLMGQKLDGLISAYVKVNKFNGSVLVARKGEVLLEKGYGINNATAGTKNDANGMFPIYSITKSFTSTMILKLAEEGKLSVQDKLARFYPDFPNANTITIEQLLSHTAGIYDYTHGNNLADYTEKSFITFLATKPLDFTPGTDWSYSNSGYWLLGFIIEKTTGMKYEAAIKHYIFDPLQMTHSGFDFKLLKDVNRETGYETFTKSLKKEAVMYDPPGPFAAGAIYSTVGDMYKYYTGIRERRLLHDQSYEKAFTSVRNNYGYGWVLDDNKGKKTVGHSGGGAGFRTNFVMVPEDDICIVILSNTEGDNPRLITQKLLDVLYERPYKIPFEIKVSQKILSQYAGSYKIKPGLSLTVGTEGGKLTAVATGQQVTFPLAEQKDYFYAVEADGYLKFIKGDDGKYDEVVLLQNKKETRGKRFIPVWGTLGSATPVGWDSPEDVGFTQSKTNKDIWILSEIKLTKGVLKFRFNDDWNLNYGDNEADGILDEAGKDINVEEGTYSITLDFSNKKAPTYVLEKKD